MRKKTGKVCLCKFNHPILSETDKITKITHRFFYKSIFSEDGLKCHPKRCKQFLRKHGFVEKKCYLASLSLYISLKQLQMNDRYFELSRWYASI